MLRQLKFILLMWVITLQTSATEEVDLSPSGKFASKQIVTTNARNVMEHYTLGSDVKDATIIYLYQHTLNYDSIQSSLSVNVSYPEEPKSAAERITKLELYLEGSEGFENQAYILEGGLGESNVTIQIEAKRTNLLRYSFIMYGIRI